MKVALVHDYLKEYGGAERVLETLVEMWPDAPIYTAYLNLEGLGKHGVRVKNWSARGGIRTSWLQRLPLANKLVSPLRVIAPAIFAGFDLSEFDVIISSCNIYFAKAVKTRQDQLHLSYIHTPPRYLYGLTTSFNYHKHFWTRIGGEIINHFLRINDFKVSQQPDILIANSKNVAGRINKFYRRDSEIIYPPIEVEQFKQAITPGEGGYFLSVSRLVKGKGVDLIIQACSELNLPLKVVGSGPLRSELEKLAGKTVEFIGQVEDRELPGIYASAGALIIAAEDEDFGITPVEAMAAGTPVVALKKGGYLETVISGKTGEFFDQATPESLKKILQSFDYTKYKKSDLTAQAEKFSKSQFKDKILDLVAKYYPKVVK